MKRTANENTRRININQEPLYSCLQTAMMLNRSISTLWRWNREGLLTPVKINRRNYYRLRDIVDFIHYYNS